MFQLMWFSLGRILVSWFMQLVLQASIVRKRSIPHGPKIIAANHPCTADPAYVTTLIDEQSSILILDTLFKVPLFGRSLKWSGHIPVVKGNGRASLEKAAQLLKAGRTIIIFPEGAISPQDGSFQKAFNGVARLAATSGVPVIPVGIGLDERYIKHVNTNVEGNEEIGTWYFYGPYAMTVGEPLVFQADLEDREQIHWITNRIMQRIEDLSYESNKRIALARVPRWRVVFPVVLNWMIARIGLLSFRFFPGR